MRKNIKDKIISLLEANPLLQAVHRVETAESNGHPFATVTASSSDGEYHSTTENQRVYAFLIRLFVERAGQTTPEAAEIVLEELDSSVESDLDKNYLLSGTVTKTGYTVLFMRTSPSRWGYAGREFEYRTSEFVVQVVVLVDINAI